MMRPAESPCPGRDRQCDAFLAGEDSSQGLADCRAFAAYTVQGRCNGVGAFCQQPDMASQCADAGMGELVARCAFSCAGNTGLCVTGDPVLNNDLSTFCLPDGAQTTGCEDGCESRPGSFQDRVVARSCQFGQCQTVQVQQCGPYECGVLNCLTSCTNNSNCHSTAYCDGGACVPR